MRGEMGLVPDGPARRRVRRAGTVRRCRIAIAVDEAERSALEDAAQAEGLTVSAFVADKALGATRQTASVRADVMRDAITGLSRATVQVQKAGTNLNQAVAAINATGQAPGNLVHYARYVTEVIRRLEEQAATVARLVP